MAQHSHESIYIFFIYFSKRENMCTLYTEIELKLYKLCATATGNRRDWFNESNITEHTNFVNNFFFNKTYVLTQNRLTNNNNNNNKRQKNLS